MLHDFLMANRLELIERCRAKAAKRRELGATVPALDYGIPLFLDQLTAMLPGGKDAGTRNEPSPHTPQSRAVTEIEAGAVLHGQELRRNEFSVEQVVHEYGDLCQAITQLAVEKSALITAEEFGILNIRLDNAIAGAVAEFARVPHASAKRPSAGSADMVSILEDMRVQRGIMAVALAAMDRGLVGHSGATARAMKDSVARIGEAIDKLDHLQHEGTPAKPAG